MPKAKKQKVLMVHNYYQIPGGEDTVVANEKKLLEDHGHEVILYTRSNQELKSMGRLRKLMLPLTTVWNPRTYREIRALIRDQHVDVLHVHNTLNLVSPSVYYAGRRCGIPVVQTVHNFRLLCPGATFYRDGRVCEDCLSGGLRCAVRHACYRGSRLQTLACVISTWFHRRMGIYGKLTYISLTDFNREKLCRLKQIRPEQVHVKPNFVEGTCSESARSGFIFVGRLETLKGVETLIQAWKILGSDAPHLIMCGIGPLEDWCRREAEGLNIELKGFVDNREVRKLIGQSRALILPTLLYEGFPMTIAEAYSVGTPVIASDLGNAGSLVEEGVTGWKFPPASAEGLAEAVRRTCDVTRNVQRVYEKRYTAEANYLKLMDIYDKASASARKRK